MVGRVGLVAWSGRPVGTPSVEADSRLAIGSGSAVLVVVGPLAACPGLVVCGWLV